MKHTLHYRRNLFLSLSSFAAILLVGSATIHVNAKVVTPRLNIKKMTLQVGSTRQLKVKKTKKRVIWKSSHKKIAYVTKKGLVKADFCCARFLYTPLRRIPPRPLQPDFASLNFPKLDE